MPVSTILWSNIISVFSPTILADEIAISPAPTSVMNESSLSVSLFCKKRIDSKSVALSFSPEITNFNFPSEFVKPSLVRVNFLSKTFTSGELFVFEYAR